MEQGIYLFISVRHFATLSVARLYGVERQDRGITGELKRPGRNRLSSDLGVILTFSCGETEENHENFSYN
jgi:hypothetical protein